MTSIKLNKAQRESVEFAGGDLLVKGVPGSGKSIVLMHRALHFNQIAIKKKQPVKILLLAFNRSLVKHMHSLVDLTACDPCMITVHTIDSYAYDLFKSLSHIYGKHFMKANEEREKVVAMALQQHLEQTGVHHRFHDVDASFWADEFLWMKQKGLFSRNAYINCDRSGRGGKVRITRQERPIVYDFFLAYQKLLKSRNAIDKEDYYWYLVQHYDKIPESAKYDYVLVDEAQDLSLIQLRFTKLITKRSITIAADKAQKIYKTAFSWKELGIDIRGRGSKTLHNSFRSTKQIIALATSLLEGNKALLADVDEYTPPKLPDRDGEIPTIIVCENASAERSTVINLVKSAISQKNSVGILYRTIIERKIAVSWLDGAKIPYQDIVYGVNWSLATPGVKLTTLHSAKGLEFDIIIIPKFEDGVIPCQSVLADAEGDELTERENSERSLLYVGMTRAKYGLFLTYSGTPSHFLQEFSPDYYNYISSSGKPLPKPQRILPSEKTPPRERITTPSSEGPSPMRTSTVSASPKKSAFNTDTAPVTYHGKGIKDGCRFIAHIQGSQESKKFNVNILLYPTQKVLINHDVGDSVLFNGKTYIIDQVL